jgi:hypothetical protein
LNAIAIIIEEISLLAHKVAAVIEWSQAETMLLGKARPKIALSFSTRRIRLGVAHHGTPSTYIAPSKDNATPQHKKKRR